MFTFSEAAVADQYLWVDLHKKAEGTMCRTALDTTGCDGVLQWYTDAEDFTFHSWMQVQNSDYFAESFFQQTNLNYLVSVSDTFQLGFCKQCSQKKHVASIQGMIYKEFKNHIKVILFFLFL